LLQSCIDLQLFSPVHVTHPQDLPQLQVTGFRLQKQMA